MKSNIFLMILLQILLIALNAVFAAAEIAVLSVNENKLNKLAEDGNRRARRLLKLTKQPAKFLATIQVAITLAGFLGSAFAADNFAGPIVNALMKKGADAYVSESTMNTIAVVVITLILSYVTLIFGELVPKRVAMRKSESLALGISGMLRAVGALFAPLVWLLTKSTNGVLRLMGIDPTQADEQASEEDIRLMVDASAENGAIDREEQSIIQNVFEFDDLTAGEIAVHRTEVTILWIEDDMQAWDETIHKGRFTFYPVCGESKDNVIGVLNAKDYYRLDSKDRETVMAEAVRPAYLVPEGVKADVLFRNMRTTRNKFAVVLDEYGGMAGIVTITDLIERLVGDLTNADDSTPPAPADIVKREDGDWEVRGTADLSEVQQELDVELPTEDCDTFGGLVFAELGTIPEDGTTCDITIGRLEIHVQSVADHQMEVALVHVLPKENTGDDEDDEDEDDAEKDSEKGRERKERDKDKEKEKEKDREKSAAAEKP